jgi:MFS family permease
MKLPGDDQRKSGRNIRGESSNQGKTQISAWKILAILSLIATMVMYAETMLLPAIPDLIKEFHITYSTSSWILSSYLISGAISIPLVSKISDLYGRKVILLIVIAIYTVGVCGGALATDIYSMIVARIVLAIVMYFFSIPF